jgi:predicted nucleic acid-binding protein
MAMSEFVLDCSVAVAWMLPDESNEQTNQLLTNMPNSVVWVPHLWRTEIANAMRAAYRQKRVSLEVALKNLEQLNVFNIQIAPEDLGQDAPAHILQFSLKHDLSSYDASYLYIASRMNLPLATLDKNLRRAATSAKIELL